jgi:diaminopimelate epimerase
MRVAITKMHGARNDFAVIDRRTSGGDDLVAYAPALCDRHTGIGADGLILIESSQRADARMRTINADGSEAEMCGNGVRCAARWLDEAGAGERMTFETDGGFVRTEIVARGPEYLVRVAMGKPAIGIVEIDGRREAFVDVGNPHVVLFRERTDDAEFAHHAAAISRERNGVNVHLAALNGGALRVVHWERGVGLTMACGTGAVACAAAAIERGLVVSPAEVVVPGGRLVVEWDGEGEAYLTGPAVRVFDTEVDLDAAFGG